LKALRKVKGLTFAGVLAKPLEKAIGEGKSDPVTAGVTDLWLRRKTG
jgi:hypothetical protein